MGTESAPVGFLSVEGKQGNFICFPLSLLYLEIGLTWTESLRLSSLITCSVSGVNPLNFLSILLYSNGII